MNPKKVIVCDLDGTLAPSKSPLSAEMADVLCRILAKHYLVIISGGAYSQFEKQFLSHFPCEPELLKNLYIFPTMGSTCYVYDEVVAVWKQLYKEDLDSEEKFTIKKALEEAIIESGLDLSRAYGEIIEDRGGQITFSGRGQEAPLEIKTAWDPTRAKRMMIVDLLKLKIPQFDTRIGGISSIDITRKGLNKAYAIKKVKEILKVTDDDIIFVGDALYKGGNDAPVKETGVDYIQESGPEETMEFLRKYL